ncbi:MAG: NADH:flavin oxidoreductase, partial [Desulfovibrio sp.]
MQNVFERTSVGSLVLKNRLFRSATYDGVSDATGHVTDSLVEIYEGLAKGGVGSIITGLAAVTDDEKILPGQ